MLSYSRPVERCQALLGTFVRLRVHGLAPERAHAAIDAGFAEIAAVHRLMSFHEADSDVSRLNRTAHRAPVRVDLHTYEVLTRALKLSTASNGAFDITIAPELAARGILPAPSGASAPDGTADWRDVVLLGDAKVHFAKPLWIDLGGIAKGYAVDRAIETLLAFSPVQACVNAGGDMRVSGQKSEHVQLRTDRHDPKAVPVVEIFNGSLASSSGRMIGRNLRDVDAGPHVDALRSDGYSALRFVSVMAPRCADADALTKVVMACGIDSEPLLSSFGAQAVLHDDELGWCEIARRA